MAAKNCCSVARCWLAYRQVPQPSACKSCPFFAFFDEITPAIVTVHQCSLALHVAAPGLCCTSSWALRYRCRSASDSLCSPLPRRGLVCNPWLGEDMLGGQQFLWSELVARLLCETRALLASPLHAAHATSDYFRSLSVLLCSSVVARCCPFSFSDMRTVTVVSLSPSVLCSSASYALVGRSRNP